MNVLSLFDGVSCGRIALERANIKVDNYFASEIDKHAIKVSKDNYPDIIQLGDITKLNLDELPKIDLLIGGFPCQDFSFAGKGLNFEGERGKLFFELVKIKNKLNHQYFFFENVNMIKEWQKIINDNIGCEPIFINSRSVSAQDRKRLYWTNIPVKEITDKNISWSDICEDGFFAGAMRGRRINEFGKRDDYNKDISIKQYIESRLDNKTNCLTTVDKDNIASTERVGRTELKNVIWRYLTRNEIERLQTLPDEYTKSVSLNQAGKLVGNAWTVDIIVEFFKNLI